MKKREIICLETCLKAEKREKIETEILPLKFDPKSGQKNAKKYHFLSMWCRGALSAQFPHHAATMMRVSGFAEDQSVLALEQAIFNEMSRKRNFLTA